MTTSPKTARAAPAAGVRSALKALEAAKVAKARSSAKKATVRPYHHGNLHTSLIDAAEVILAEHGVQALTLRDVARAAEVSHAAPYHHFASLNELLAALAQRGFEALGKAMATAVAVPDTRERLLSVAQAYVAFARAQPERFRLMFGPVLANKDAHPLLKAAAEQAFGHVLQAAIAHDKKHGADLAIAGWSLAHGLSHLLIDGALEGMPIKHQHAHALVRALSERIFSGS